VIRALVLYDRAPDARRYAAHVEVSRRVPADAFRHGPVFGAPRGEPKHAYFAEFEWRERGAFDAAMASSEWIDSGRDAMAMGIPFTVEFAELDGP
jgi:hypothetical protein